MTTNGDDMDDLHTRLAVLDGLKEEPAITKSTNPYSGLASPQLRWRFRQEREKWEKFVAGLRDPDSNMEKIENRDQLADAIEAALQGVDDDGEAGTA